MKFGYAIVYVPDVAAAVAFYERAFGLATRFADEGGSYAELETGPTALAFASEANAAALGLSVRPNRPEGEAAAVEIALVTEEVPEAFERAVAAGAVAVAPPATKPWGQTVGYVRDLNGVLVELCTPITS